MNQPDMLTSGRTHGIRCRITSPEDTSSILVTTSRKIVEANRMLNVIQNNRNDVFTTTRWDYPGLNPDIVPSAIAVPFRAQTNNSLMNREIIQKLVSAAFEDVHKQERSARRWSSPKPNHKSLPTTQEVEIPIHLRRCSPITRIVSDTSDSPVEVIEINDEGDDDVPSTSSQVFGAGRKRKRVTSQSTIPRSFSPARKTEAALIPSMESSDEEQASSEGSVHVDSDCNASVERMPGDQHHTFDESSSHTKKKQRKSLVEIRDEKWEARFRLLVEYNKEHGTTRVPLDDPIIGNWVAAQRKAYRKGNLSLYRQQRLLSLGFQWSIRSSWEVMYQQLLSYKKKFGTTRVPKTRKEYWQLRGWVNRQREFYSHGKLSKTRIQLLECIGFEWQLGEKYWMVMYERLLAYKETYNSTCVPKGFKEDPKLGAWVATQRYKCIEQRRIDLLNEIGFEWTQRQDHWMKMYNRLVEYKKEHGTTVVPRLFRGDSQLGRWVYTQRSKCKEKYRIDLLNQINFVWKIDTQPDPYGMAGRARTA